MKKIVINLPEKLWKTLKLMAVEKETSMSNIIREGIYLYILIDKCGANPTQDCINRLVVEYGGMIIFALNKLKGESNEKEETEAEGSED